MTFDNKFIVENTEIARLLFQRMLIANRFPPVENSMKFEQQLHKTLANLEIKVKQVQRCIWCIRSGQKYTQEKRWVADMEHVEYLHFQNEIGYMNNITLRDVYADRIRPTKKNGQQHWNTHFQFCRYQSYMRWIVDDWNGSTT